MKEPIGNKKMLRLYIETGKQKVAELLFKYPEREFSLSDIAVETGVRKSNVGAILDEFHNIGLIEITKLSKIWRIKANMKNWAYMKSKIVYNLNFIYQSGIVDFLINHYKNPKAIVLFGSLRKGEDISSSDIDIAIESDEIKEYTITGLRELAEFEKIAGRKVQIHLFNRKNIDINVFNNISNGIVLFGFLEVKP